MSFISAQMSRHLGASGRIEENQDRAVTVRQASTALLSVDSLDRDTALQSAGDFVINKNQNIFSGFFTRIALNEIVLDWCIDNISGKHVNPNNTLTVTIAPTTITVTLPDGKYTASDVLDTLLALLNAAGPAGFGANTFRLEDSAGAPWVVGTSFGTVFLATTAGADFTVDPSALANQLDIETGALGVNSYPIDCPKFLPIFYVDFVSPQLTYNQDLKDNTTAPDVRDVLYRWVLAYDNGPIPLDKYNFPIFQGYKSFISRRYLSYPKQILWNPATPVGQLSFQMYQSDGTALIPEDLSGNVEFQMSMLFTES